MRKYFTVLAAIASIVALVFYFIKPSEEDRRVTSVDPELIPIKEELLALNQDHSFQQLSSQGQLDRINEVLEHVPDSHRQLKRQYQVAISSLPSIEFYGRVIDQNGNPVKDASIFYTGEDAYLSAGGGMGQVRTDEDGYFVIKTNGAALELGGVRHPEIDSVSYERPDRLVNDLKAPKELAIRFVSHDKIDPLLNYNNYSSKNRAYRIQAWRLGEYEGAISGDLNGYFNYSGKVYTLDLTGKTYKKIKLEGERNGTLRVSCIRKDMENFNDYGDWEITVTPINGGIQETTDLYMNIAPATGYQASINIVMHKDASGYVPHLRNKRYYFTSNNGKEYGSLFVHFDPHARYDYEDGCRINFASYKINPTGSRNLELKRDKSSQQQKPSPQIHGMRLASTT